MKKLSKLLASLCNSMKNQRQIEVTIHDSKGDVTFWAYNIRTETQENIANHQTGVDEFTLKVTDQGLEGQNHETT